LLIRWQWKTFDELSTKELYSILRARNEVFIVEKNCPWNEVDGDEAALHLIGYDNQSLFVAYARLLCPKNKNEPIHFGRVLVIKEHRGKGIGKQLIQLIFDKIISLGYESNPIEILANHTPVTEKLYADFGFKKSQIPFKIEGGSELVTMFHSPLSSYQNKYDPFFNTPNKTTNQYNKSSLYNLE
jgi:ElaA protein